MKKWTVRLSRLTAGLFAAAFVLALGVGCYHTEGTPEHPDSLWNGPMALHSAGPGVGAVR